MLLRRENKAVQDRPLQVVAMVGGDRQAAPWKRGVRGVNGLILVQELIWLAFQAKGCSLPFVSVTPRSAQVSVTARKGLAPIEATLAECRDFCAG